MILQGLNSKYLVTQGYGLLEEPEAPEPVKGRPFAVVRGGLLAVPGIGVHARIRGGLTVEVDRGA